MTLAESVVRETLAEERAALKGLEDGTTPTPPWGNREKAIEECKERIASLQSKINDPNKLADWWESIPLTVRESWYNM